MKTKKRVDVGGLIFFMAVTLIMLGVAGFCLSLLNPFFIIVGIGVLMLWSLILYIYLESGFYTEEDDHEDPAPNYP